MNMDEVKIKKIIEDAEKSVSFMTEGELKKIAFAVILKHYISQIGKTKEQVGISNNFLIKQNKIQGIDALEVMTSREGFPDLYKLNKGQQLLWLLSYCAENHIEELTNSQLSVLASRFKLDIPAKNITALNGTNFKKGYIALKNGQLRILQKGIDTLKETTSTNEP